MILRINPATLVDETGCEAHEKITLYRIVLETLLGNSDPAYKFGIQYGEHDVLIASTDVEGLAEVLSEACDEAKTTLSEELSLVGVWEEAIKETAIVLTGEIPDLNKQYSLVE